MDIAPLPVDITGHPRIATAVNGTVPTPILRWREGDAVKSRPTATSPWSAMIQGVVWALFGSGLQYYTIQQMAGLAVHPGNAD